MTDNLNVNGTVRGKMSKLAKWAWGIATSAIGLAFIAGIIFWGGFNTVLEATNTETFCISCHEMEKNVYVEYRNTIHYQNRTGVRATCPDCHVPKQWFPKIIRKIQASNELLHKALGSIDTPEKFNAKRLELAQHEWDRMKKNDSQECRNCHTFTSMDYAEQNRRAATLHQIAFNQGHTCIDCHKGIAHTLPPIEQHIGAPKPDSAEMPSDKPLNPPVAVPPPAAPAAATTPPAPAAATTPAAPATPPPAGK